MSKLSTIFAMCVGLLVVAAITGVPQVVHLCKVTCTEAADCCEEETPVVPEDCCTDEGPTDCCTDLLAIHQVQITCGLETIMTQQVQPAVHLVKSIYPLNVTDQALGRSMPLGSAIAPYLHALNSAHPPRPESTPLRV